MYLIAKFLSGWADANFTFYIDSQVNNKKCDFAKKNLVNKKSQQVDGASSPGHFILVHLPSHLSRMHMRVVKNISCWIYKKPPHRIWLFSFLGYLFCCSLTYRIWRNFTMKYFRLLTLTMDRCGALLSHAI